MFCPECGKPLLENAAVCQACGASVPKIVLDNEGGGGSAGTAAHEADAPVGAAPGGFMASEEPAQSIPQVPADTAPVAPPLSSPPTAITPPGAPPLAAVTPSITSAIQPSPPSPVQAAYHGLPGSASPAAAQMSAPTPAVPGEMPPIIKNLRLYAIIAAAANGLSMCGYFLIACIMGIATYGCGCVLMALPLINLVALILDIMAIMKLSGPPSPAVMNSVKTAAIGDCVAFCAVVPTIMGILNLQNIAKEEVKGYFHG